MALSIQHARSPLECCASEPACDDTCVRCRHVIVIPRLTQRLADSCQRVEVVGVAYELLNGTAGREPIPTALLDLYLGPRLRHLVLEQHDWHWVMVAANLLSHVQVGGREAAEVGWCVLRG